MTEQSAETMLHEFVEKMIDEQNLTTADAEIRAQLSADLQEEAETLIQAKIVEALSPKYLDEFEALLDRDASAEEIQNYLSAKIPNYAGFIAAALLEFRQSYLNPARA